MNRATSLLFCSPTFRLLLKKNVPKNADQKRSTINGAIIWPEPAIFPQIVNQSDRCHQPHNYGGYPSDGGQFFHYKPNSVRRELPLLRLR